MTLRLRPRFNLIVDLKQEELLKILENKKNSEKQCIILVVDNRIEFRIVEHDRHFWSPFLNVVVSNNGEDSTTIRGKYGPNANVWTMFTAIYAMFSILIAGALIYGFSQISLGLPATAIWSALGFFIAIIVVYLVGLIGKKLAQPQMEVFHRCISECFSTHIVNMVDESDRQSGDDRQSLD